jgi:hypothetical protein
MSDFVEDLYGPSGQLRGNREQEKGRRPWLTTLFMTTIESCTITFEQYLFIFSTSEFAL